MRTAFAILASFTLLLVAGSVRADDTKPDTPAPPAEKPAERGYVGFAPVPVPLIPAAVREQNGITATTGVIVRNVLPKGPAANAGLKAGDILLKVNGQPMPETKDLDPTDREKAMQEFGQAFLKIAEGIKAGTEVEIVVERDGKPVTLKATAVDKDTRDKLEAAARAEEEAKEDDEAEKPSEADLQRGYVGFHAAAAVTLTPKQRDAIKGKPEHGVVVVRVLKGSPAEKAGIQVGDVLVKYAGVAMPADIELEASKEKAGALVGEAVGKAARTIKPGYEVEIGVLREGKATVLKAKAVDHAAMEKIASAPENEEGDDDQDDDDDEHDK